MELIQALHQRRSVRAYLSTEVPAAQVQQLLQEAARAASGGNLQPWRVLALTGAPLKQVLSVVAQSSIEEAPTQMAYPPSLWEP